MSLGRGVAVTLLATMLTAFAGSAPARPLMTPAQLAAAIEKRADKTSFTELERFGARSAKGEDRESLNRLEHVAQVMLNQSEFARFEKWNGILARNAEAAHDQRYIEVARINELNSRYARGDTSVEGEIAEAARDTPDWFARVYAKNTRAIMLIKEDKAGAAF